MNWSGRLLLVTLISGCGPEEPIELVGFPSDATQQRVRSVLGDQLDRELAARRYQSPRNRRKIAFQSEGDWRYNTGADVNGGVAVYSSAFSGGTTATCLDRLFVPVARNGSASATSYNVYGFDNLYPAIPGGGGSCVNGGSDGGACDSPFCPRRIWRVRIDGTLSRNSLAVNLDGTRVYATTSTGRLYALDTTTGAVVWMLDTRSAAELGATSAAIFDGSSPWVNYFDAGTMYAAVSYGTGGSARIRVYKLGADGAVLARLTVGSATVPETLRSSVISDGPSMYLGTTNGRLYKINDVNNILTLAAPWPIQLRSKSGMAGTQPDTAAPIYGTPSLDWDGGLLFVPVNNVFWSVNTQTGAANWVEGGWQNPQEAANNNVPCYSSPWVDVDVRTVYVAHGKNQNTPMDQRNRLHRREYFADGSFNLGNLTSVATAGSANPDDLTDPKSSPLVLRQNPGLSWVFLGDAGGIFNRWNYTNNFAGRITFDTGSGSNGAIESPIVIDVMSGNIYFGSNNNRVYQISQATLR